MYQQPLDVVNRALQRCGLPRMGATGDAQPGQEIMSMYDKVRRAELRRNLWVFATRTVSLRALDTLTQLVNFPAYAASTTYPAGYIVTYQNLTWVSLIDGNLGNAPGNPATSGLLPWDVYYGPVSAGCWNDSIQNTITTTNTTYHVGELAWYLTTSNIYVSLAENNQNDPTAVDAYSALTMYASGAVVSYLSTNYQSLVNQNFGNTPSTSPSQWTSTVTNPTVSGSWKQLTSATLSSNPIIYPVTAGPASDYLSRNAFLKPAGYLRMAPLGPKAGANAWLGAHVGLAYSDIIEQGKYLTTGSDQVQMILRFVADVTDVATMDDMFCEGFSARLAMEASPIIAPDKQRSTQAHYNEAMSEARIVDAIEEGPIEQDEDDFITCRI